MGALETRGSLGAVLPEQFGKYSLLAHLATGGMAEVWLARQAGLQGFEKIVVIKRARPELLDHETTAMFLDEARLVATLEHPNIAQVYEIGAINGSYFFVMEFVDGADLRRLIETALARKHRISLADALYIITHVCTALHYAHEKRDLEGRPLHIIHRDVSPSNVLISHDGAIKVCDFGIAKAHNRRSENTQSGVLKGKFSYMSPEQCQSRPLDRRSDIFSIGILLYELTTLTKLFRGAGDLAVLQQIVDAPIPRPSSRVADYPPELEQIVMKALAKAPEARYQTAQALQLDLEELAREHKLATSSVRVAQLMSTLFEKRTDAWIRAQIAHHDHFIEVGARGSDSVPAFLAVGSAPTVNGGGGIRDQATAVLDSQRGAVAQPGSASSSAVSGAAFSATAAAVVAPPRGGMWFVAAIVAALVAGGITIADRVVAAANERSLASGLQSDAERLSATLDAAARSAHLRVDGIATTPMLRAAIETDAATMNDLANSEVLFSAGKGEALEVFQQRGDRAVSMLRIPRTAAALPGMRGRATQVQSDGAALTMFASAPVAGYRQGLVGGLVISVPVELAALRRALGEHATHAALVGLGRELSLVGEGAVPAVGAQRLALASSGEWSAEGVGLIATAKPATGVVLAAPVRALSMALAALLLAGGIVSRVRRSRS